MKSKHCTYDKKVAFSTFCGYYLNDNIPCKRTITALLGPWTVIVK